MTRKLELKPELLGQELPELLEQELPELPKGRGQEIHKEAEQQESQVHPKT